MQLSARGLAANIKLSSQKGRKYSARSTPIEHQVDDECLRQVIMQAVGPAHLLDHRAAERLNLAVLKRIDSATEEV